VLKGFLQDVGGLGARDYSHSFVATTCQSVALARAEASAKAEALAEGDRQSGVRRKLRNWKSGNLGILDLAPGVCQSLKSRIPEFLNSRVNKRRQPGGDAGPIRSGRTDASPHLTNVTPVPCSLFEH
jgi:hypothetical protein